MTLGLTLLTLTATPLTQTNLRNDFESYTSSTSSVESGQGRSDEGRNTAIEQIVGVLLSKDGNYVQDLLLHESAVALDATVRDALLSPLEPLRNSVTWVAHSFSRGGKSIA